jgi:hypothetical protein
MIEAGSVDYYVTSIIRTVKWVGQVVGMGKRGMHTKLRRGNTLESDQLQERESDTRTTVRFND